jgi:hypothetical protein
MLGNCSASQPGDFSVSILEREHGIEHDGFYRSRLARACPMTAGSGEFD